MRALDPVWTARGQGDDALAAGERRATGKKACSACRATIPNCCREGCAECADVCPTRAIPSRARRTVALAVDYGRCVVCQLCTEACPTGAHGRLLDWAFGVSPTARIWSGSRRERGLVEPAAAGARSGFRRSLHIRHVDAGSCNGCESELQALNNPFYNLHRLGIFFTAVAAFCRSSAGHRTGHPRHVRAAAGRL